MLCHVRIIYAKNFPGMSNVGIKHASLYDNGRWCPKLIVRLHEEYKRTGKTLLITDYSHLDLLTSLAQKHTCYLRFDELDEALFYAENSLLERMVTHRNQNRFASLTNSC